MVRAQAMLNPNLLNLHVGANLQILQNYHSFRLANSCTFLYVHDAPLEIKQQQFISLG